MAEGLGGKKENRKNGMVGGRLKKSICRARGAGPKEN